METYQYPHVPIVDSAKGWASTFFYCKEVAPPNQLQGLAPFTDEAGTPLPSWKKKPSARMPADHAAIQARISELTSGSPPLTGEDTIICWVKRRIQPLQHRTRLLCEYTDNADPMRTSEKDMDCYPQVSIVDSAKGWASTSFTARMSSFPIGLKGSRLLKT